ncbi:competence type IV pilus ATPase ComGA [Lysinibacillus endophyticus]|uniref:competence type IV pilus ATPase ComGA n=1 Tax=Ureibacillus endophyticus TaxID=1978490 RepID=UPI0020A00C94|nr:competence type IV pilus ATPase ComGA [Lysinibacillus endophyticus]MCP1145222.1 Flp pilus assembly complex ATPase component TadA [Lysinibacillus endophyticus]
MDIESVVENKSIQLLVRAIHFGASDLHILPTTEYYKIHFRKYGKLFPAGNIPFELGDRMISFFKFLSSLDISEKRKPQSGSFQKNIEENIYSFRVSTLPSVYRKESLVIRLLLQNSRHPITSLCLFPNAADKLIQLVSNRQGLLLFCGATGSGKTTSLYSLINYCSETLARQVISLEDPVESNQTQLLQIQVNERAGVTYASGLKAILRHSPDVIMIGEIRDKETAKVAIEAALTGHLVLSTVHSKDTVNCLYRLMDLDISLEEMRQAIIGIVAQCLVQVDTDERKAIYEILSEFNLVEAIYSTMRGDEYRLPKNETISYQLSKLEVNQNHVPTTIS